MSFSDYHKTFKYMAFQYFDHERNRTRLSQKRVVRTKLDIYVSITITVSGLLVAKSFDTDKVI
jgi:hypothetical protein